MHDFGMKHKKSDNNCCNSGARLLLRDHPSPPRAALPRKDFFARRFPRSPHARTIGKTIVGIRGKSCSKPVADHSRKWVEIGAFDKLARQNLLRVAVAER
jgi:hypothetical protein